MIMNEMMSNINDARAEVSMRIQTFSASHGKNTNPAIPHHAHSSDFMTDMLLKHKKFLLQ